MVIFTLSGSLRKGSSNTAILHTLKSLTQAHNEFILYDKIDTLPHFNPDLDNETPPPAVQELRGMIKRSDIIVISTPEYAHGVPGSLKNALDWLVSTVVHENKPTGIILGSSTDGQYAREALIEILKTMNARVVPELVITLSGIQAKRDQEGTQQMLEAYAARLQQTFC